MYDEDIISRLMAKYDLIEEEAKEYLTSREKEVVEIMNILFDQEYAMERRVLSEKIAAAMEMCQEHGDSKEDTVKRIAQKYQLDETDAEWYAMSLS